MIIGNIKLINCKIDFNEEKGHDNYIYCDNTDGEVILENSTIQFRGSNSVLFLTGGNKKSYRFKAYLGANCCIYIGKASLFHVAGNVHLVAGEEKHIIIGSECMIAYNIWIRTGDAHAIYSCETKEKINHPKSVVIGDHAWLAHECMVSKGAIVGSGAIMGARSFLANKIYFSNSIYVGTPARMLSKEGEAFFDKVELNFLDHERLNRYQKFDSDKFIYKYDKDKCIINEMLCYLDSHTNVIDRINYFKNISKDKNRFAISSEFKL